MLPQAPDDTDRLYLDNAATSFPKAPGVYEAMLDYGRRIGASPGRGAYAESRQGSAVILRCRERLARLLDAETPDRIVFTLNTTDALNTAIQGLVAHHRRTRPGAPIRIITSAMDHNSVLRPLNMLRRDGVSWCALPADPATGLIDPADFARAINPETALVALVHASNVTGCIQPIDHVGRLCREQGVPFLVDAAQSLGHVPINVRECGIDLLAFPGHKGLLGPLGTGGLYIRPGVEGLIDPYRQGGTGSQSEQDTHPDVMPSRYECGSHNTVGIAGLSRAVEWILEHGVASLRAHETELINAMLAGLEGLAPLGYRLIGSAPSTCRVATFSVTHDTISPHELAMEMERRDGLLVRAGIHCAPRAHETMGTIDRGGGARISFGAFNTLEHVHRTLACLEAIGRDLAIPVRSAAR
ncbi:MAG: aminotransferase class V-fold PLP-dependent enzyme [Phycisphaeraceae bacterium]|nr:aminotransferase class V-fold PLP-dependent enzyme [Phycisphaeraceae bacterium]